MVVSPCQRLVLFNYTDFTTYERAWDEYTMSARGIIFEKDTGKIVARPFKKFFNIGEHETTFLPNLPKTQYHIHEKLDGSLGIIYFYDGKWDIATRGSFTSDQANYARLNLLPKYAFEKSSLQWTLLTEIIYPENKIVVNYSGRSELVLLGVINKTTQRSLPGEMLKEISDAICIPLAKNYSHTIEQCIELKSTLPKDDEGFVVHWPECDTRIKIKGDEYMKIAKIMAHMTPLAFWEVMEQGGKVPLSYLEQIPEELRPMWEPIVAELEHQYSYVQAKLEIDLTKLPSLTDRKAIGLFIKDNAESLNYPRLIFPRISYGNAHDGIMKVIRPTGNDLGGEKK